METHGPGAVVAVLDKAVETRDAARAIAAVTGVPFKTFYEKWLAWVKEQKFEVVPGLKALPPKWFS